MLVLASVLVGCSESGTDQGPPADTKPGVPLTDPSVAPKTILPPGSKAKAKTVETTPTPAPAPAK
jgi:hypothetical protein